MNKTMRFFCAIGAFPILLILFSEVHGQIVPEGLLDFFPQNCMDSLEKDLLPCAIENACFSLLPSDEEIASIPSASEVGSCADIERALCPVTSRCLQCKDKADDIFKCVITNGDNIPQNITDLVDGCSLECNLSPETTAPVASTTTAAPVDVPPAPTDAPVVPATDAPVPPDTSPADGPETIDEPVTAGAVRKASRAGIIVGVSALLLAW